MSPKYLQSSMQICHKDRVLIADPYTRSLLQRYAKEQPPLTMLEFTKMVELLGFHSQPLQNLVKSFGNSTCPPPYVPFLKSLALDSPICGMFHPSKNLRQTLIEMREKDPKTSPKLLEDLQMQLPLYTKDKNKHTILILLYDWILNSFSYYSTQVFKLICLLSRTPPELIELLISLEEKAAESYPPDTMASLSEDETELKLNSFFPSLPIQRCRGTYEMDLKGCRKSSHDCNKKSRGHPSLLPGVFCLFCEHGICYGYELMDSNESPNIPFTLLLTRFKKAPSTVIYDNSCKLHTYCLNRYPDFFRGTWFLVDRLHWFNHRGCNDGYNLNEYAQFSSLNSQAAEQCNSSLA
ncbi:uncharacterized protein LOC128160826 [Crassostrea angulata]|uniref:uncharacterized protein LOC128160826 n=1 Tax=Magallana angulata TaxID=2784310 RepID=UPI0022B08572|nr:uncharacterized protein LOC128160826 [Crassostrea angulata]